MKHMFIQVPIYIYRKSLGQPTLCHETQVCLVPNCLNLTKEIIKDQLYAFGGSIENLMFLHGTSSRTTCTLQSNIGSFISSLHKLDINLKQAMNYMYLVVVLRFKLKVLDQKSKPLDYRTTTYIPQGINIKLRIQQNLFFTKNHALK